jgi:hypothetical protein
MGPSKAGAGQPSFQNGLSLGERANHPGAPVSDLHREVFSRLSNRGPDFQTFYALQ